MNSNKRWLVLVPTEQEAKHLDFADLQVDVAICGFGPVVSAARTAALIEQRAPNTVMLIGIAGAYSHPGNNSIVVGSAYQFPKVRMHGIGIGHGEQHVSSGESGWKQFAAEPDIGDELFLHCEQAFADAVAGGTLITVCSASADAKEANRIQSKYPDVVAEDMEGFAVAAAARLFGLPACIVRGISNQAGDRNHPSWQIETALRSANELAFQIIRNKA